jgi:ferric hydroxamate transport system substrate-binding protein
MHPASFTKRIGGAFVVALALCLLVAGPAGARTQKITLKDGIGRTVTIPKQASRVVALEWSLAEDVLALKPTVLVGVADIKGYRTWLKTPPIKDGVTDVGTRAQPSLETIAALKPDLILTASIRVGDTLPQLSAIAPTLVFNQYPTSITQYQEMEQTFNTIAKATSTQLRAKKLLSQVEGTYTRAKRILAQRGITRFPVTATQAFTAGGQSVARLFTPKALVSQVIAKMGLRIGWDGDPGQFGFTTVGLEGISRLPADGYLLVVAQPNDNPFVGSWAGNSAYQALPMVKANKVLILRSDTWFFGGPISAGQLVRQILARLTPN